MLPLFIQLAMAQVFTPVPDPWVGVVGAPSGAVAVWSHARVAWSARGEAFAPILADDAPIDATALDDDGTAWVARGARLGVRSPDGGERWIQVPGPEARTRALHVRRGRVVWLGRLDDDGDDTFMVSRDGGVTFEHRPDWPVGNYETVIALDARGRVQIIAGHEASCGGGYQERVAGAIGDLALRAAGWGYDAPVDYFAAPSGWAYLGEECDGVEGIVALPPTGASSVCLGVARREASRAWLLGAGDDRRAWLAVDGRLVEAVGANARVVDPLPREVRALAVAGGRPWALAAGGLHALDDGAWRVVPLR